MRTIFVGFILLSTDFVTSELNYIAHSIQKPHDIHFRYNRSFLLKSMCRRFCSSVKWTAHTEGNLQLVNPSIQVPVIRFSMTFNLLRPEIRLNNIEFTSYLTIIIVSLLKDPTVYCPWGNNLCLLDYWLLGCDMPWYLVYKYSTSIWGNGVTSIVR